MESQTPQAGHDRSCAVHHRTHVEPLSRWAGIPGALDTLVDMLDGMTPQMRDYKGVDLFEAALKAHLRPAGRPVS